ncbi:MAG: heme exporter protein CcmB [Alphaproteobacteria bacterium]|nr:heme exporter protein CcmB [Alphaproteobacteria bacterium]
MRGLRLVLAVVRKELLLEWRDPSRLTGLLVFSAALTLLLAFAMPGVHVLPDVAAGAIWLGLVLASTRSLDQSFRTEVENGALEGLVLWPVPSLVIFHGKALANAIVLLLVAVPLTALVFVLYHPRMHGSVVDLGVVLTLGCMALAAPGTLVAAIATQARGSSALLPVLFFPLVVPVVLAATRATTLVLEGDPMDQVGAWVKLLLVFDLAHWTLDGLLFSRIVDEG